MGKIGLPTKYFAVAEAETIDPGARAIVQNSTMADTDSPLYP
jgi:hypothetical protein